jgi:hypothetical protein
MRPPRGGLPTCRSAQPANTPRTSCSNKRACVHRSVTLGQCRVMASALSRYWRSVFLIRIALGSCKSLSARSVLHSRPATRSPRSGNKAATNQDSDDFEGMHSTAFCPGSTRSIHTRRDSSRCEKNIASRRAHRTHATNSSFISSINPSSSVPEHPHAFCNPPRPRTPRSRNPPRHDAAAAGDVVLHQPQPFGLLGREGGGALRVVAKDPFLEARSTCSAKGFSSRIEPDRETHQRHQVGQLARVSAPFTWLACTRA